VQYGTFTLDGLLFGIEVDRIQEVIRAQEMTAVPLAPPVIGGLINLRGEIVTAIDLRRRLQLAERSTGTAPMNVVIRTRDGAISLLVDQIGDVVDVAPDSFEEPPGTLTGVALSLIRGAHKLDGCLLLVLDTDRVVQVSTLAA
jgi:purine-binding chemotaxis protein CheW